MRVDARAARRFLVARQLLAPARSLQGGLNAIRAVFARLGSIQFDPLGVAGRNHDLVLHARVADYDPAWCEELLYERRELFEAYNKGLSLLPTPELPYFNKSTWLHGVEREHELLAQHAEEAERILERIRADGPLCTLDFDRGPEVDWFWAPTNLVRSVLEAYAITGVLGLARRDGNRRYYDLAERLFPAELLAREVSPRDQLRHKLLSRFRAHGLAGTGGSQELWFGTGRARPDPRRPEPSRAELREELVEEGELIPVEVEGVRGTRFVLRDELELLASPPPPAPSVALLAPLDPLIWDRALLRSLFGFDYVWEVYVPEPKRRWGYYVLPVLFGDQIVGRIEPRIDRATATIQVLGLWWEEGFAPRRADGLPDAMRAALRAYLAFAGARRLEWAPHLARERRLLGPVL